MAEQNAARSAPAGAAVSARLGTLDARLRPAPCAKAEAFVPRGVSPWGVTRMGLRCIQGAVAWTLYLPVQVQVQAAALSLKTALPAGSLITEADLVRGLQDWSARPQAPLTDADTALGRTLVRAMPAGGPLRETDLQARRWFAAGDRVKVISSGAGFHVAADGLALSEGRDGQRVRVQLLLRTDASQGANPSNRGPIIQGEAVGKHLVEMPL